MLIIALMFASIIAIIGVGVVRGAEYSAHPPEDDQ